MRLVCRLTALILTICLTSPTPIASAQDAPGPPRRETGERTAPLIIGQSARVTEALSHQQGDFVRSGLTGLYERLRAREVRRDTEHTLRPWRRYQNPETPANGAHFYLRQIVLKWRQDAPVRLRDGALTVVPIHEAPLGSSERQRPTLDALTRDLAAFSSLVQETRATLMRATPNVEEADLDRLRALGQDNIRSEIPDLNLFYYLLLPQMSPEAAQSVVMRLRALQSIEVAYFAPIPANAQDRPPVTTIDVTQSQGYLRPAPAGIDVDLARRFPGGRGADVRIADVEFGWTLNHEDMAPLAFGFGFNGEAFGGTAQSHGTAVIGELGALTNSYGAEGVVPDALIGYSSVSTLGLDPLGYYNVPNALMQTPRVMRPGDIVVIEQHFPMPAVAATAGCAPEATGYVAVETFPFEHAAILSLTAAGIIVVEPAGNGQRPVIPAAVTSSGAIVVGANLGGGSLASACFTNFGPRVDVQAWGGMIGTLGGGETTALRANGGDATQFYTVTFGGTSGATPIVAGAAALVQSRRVAMGLPRLTPAQMRTLLATTGTPQVAGSPRPIGPQPNLRAAFMTFMPDAARLVSQTSSAANPLTPGQGFSVTVVFQNVGPLAWTGSHRLAINDLSGQSVWGTLGFALGSPGTPVNAPEQITRTFPLHAPTTPGTYPLVVTLRDASGAALASSDRFNIVVGSAQGAFDNGVINGNGGPRELRNGRETLVEILLTNTGNTTWSFPSYGVRLTRNGRISLPSGSSLDLPENIAPGQSLLVHFAIHCNGAGQGGYGAQISGPSGLIGIPLSNAVTCTS